MMNTLVEDIKKSKGSVFYSGEYSGKVTFKKNVSYIGKDKQPNLLNDALVTLRLLNSTNNKTMVPRIFDIIFLAF